MHTEYTLLMSLALDGEASAAEESRLRQHLAVCVQCAATWAQWRRWDEHLRAAPLLSPAPGFAQRVQQRLTIQKRLTRAQHRIWPGWAGVAAALIGFGALSLLLAGGVVVALWKTSNPLLASVLLSAVAQLASAAVWPLRSLTGVLAQWGVPACAPLGGFVAGIAALTGIWYRAGAATRRSVSGRGSPLTETCRLRRGIGKSVRLADCIALARRF